MDQQKVIVRTSNWTLASLIRTKISLIRFCTSSRSRNFLKFDSPLTSSSFRNSSSRVLNSRMVIHSMPLALWNTYALKWFIHGFPSLLSGFQPRNASSTSFNWPPVDAICCATASSLSFTAWNKISQNAVWKAITNIIDLDDRPHKT